MNVKKIAFTLIILSTLFMLNCPSTEMIRFENSLKNMSNAELLSCHRGINERIKDINYNISRKDRPSYGEHQNDIPHQTHIVGGEAYGLMQKEKMVLKEMKKRNLSPESQ